MDPLFQNFFGFPIQHSLINNNKSSILTPANLFHLQKMNLNNFLSQQQTISQNQTDLESDYELKDSTTPNSSQQILDDENLNDESLINSNELAKEKNHVKRPMK